MKYYQESTNAIVAAILMTVRDEESLIELNLSYHLDLGFDYIFIINHCSEDSTSEVLSLFESDPRIVILEESAPTFDHAKLINKLLQFVIANYTVDWFAFFDADEFLVISEGDIHSFLDRLGREGVPYVTIGWQNALFDRSMADYRCAPVNAIDTSKFFLPFPEREWQEFGHFRKALVKRHENMEVVVGGHYVETKNDRQFFGEYHWNPFIIPAETAHLLHFEFRGTAEEIYSKWETLAKFEDDSTSGKDAPWLERIRTVRQYVERFRDNVSEIDDHWFREHRTFWGTRIPEDRVNYDSTLLIWYRKYFRRKIESGSVKSVCLVRSGHLGDVIMSEPIAKFLSSFVDKVFLATELTNVSELLDCYDNVFDLESFKREEVDCDMAIKLVYELSANSRSYIDGYMESVGFGEISVDRIPKLIENHERFVEEEYVLIAPHTSNWQEAKRCWEYERFMDLSSMIEKHFDLRCIILENHYGFSEMISLIRHCNFFVGNDSAPAIISQSFDRTSFVIFGATRPEYLHLGKNTVPIVDRNRHKLCQHQTRAEEISCCEEFCMERIRTNDVFDIIQRHVESRN